MRNEFARARVTRTFPQHLEHGSAGGVDYAVPAGTSIHAPAAGVVTYRRTSGSAGWIARLTYDDGTATEWLHVSAFIGASGRRVEAGDEIALSGGIPGAPGAGASEGAHVHVHDLDKRGNRTLPYGGSTSTGTGEDDMKVIRTAKGAVLVFGGKIAGIATEADAKALEKICQDGVSVNIGASTFGFIEAAAKTEGTVSLAFPTLTVTPNK